MLFQSTSDLLQKHLQTVEQYGLDRELFHASDLYIGGTEGELRLDPRAAVLDRI